LGFAGTSKSRSGFWGQLLGKPKRGTRRAACAGRAFADLSPEKWHADGKQDFSLSLKSLRKSLVTNDVPGGIRTHNLLIRSQMLYPVELQTLLTVKRGTKVKELQG
jgi:hypothetical protein